MQMVERGLTTDASVQPWPAVAHVAAPTAPVEGAANWKGKELQASDEWKFVLAAQDIAELEAALAHAKLRKLGLLEMRTQDEFPLGELAGKLRALRRELHHGRGFTLVKGLDLDRYSQLEAAMLYWGIGLHLGYPVPQNAKGHMLGHIVDLGKLSDPEQALPDGTKRPFIAKETRGYNSRERFFFHQDFGDVVGLMCLRPAMKGGNSLIVSAVAIHNEIQRTRPDLLDVLYQPFYVSRQNELPSGARPYYRMPVFQIHEGRFTVWYLRAFMENCSKFPELPTLTDRQREAFDLIDRLADDPEFHLDMDLERGDIQFINNQDILHTRMAYEDHDDPALKRHLLRLWLVAPDARPLSHWVYDQFGQGRRGGIYVPGVVERADFEA